MLTRRQSKQVLCSICLQTCKSVIGRIQCRHSYCLECILEWSSIRNSCPFCKAKITKIIQFQVITPRRHTVEPEPFEVESSSVFHYQRFIYVPSEDEPNEESLDENTPIFDVRRPRPFRPL